MKWITRERPKIDRIACPWLVAISKGLSLNFTDGHEMLKYRIVIDDALYARCADTPLKKVAHLLGAK